MSEDADLVTSLAGIRDSLRDRTYISDIVRVLLQLGELLGTDDRHRGRFSCPNFKN